MEKEVPGILRPTGGTKQFRRNCRLVAEDGAIAVTNRDGRTTRFLQDGTDTAPTEMMSYLGQDLFIILDRQGRGVVLGHFAVWDSAENAQFCELAGLENSVTNTFTPPDLRPDGVRLEEPAWLTRYMASAPYVMGGGVALAGFGRALDFPVWLMLPFIPWLLLYPVVRSIGYFAPQRPGLSDLRETS
jgi:hypothetical protein